MSLIWGRALRIAKMESIGGKAASLQKLETLGYKGASFAVLPVECVEEILSGVRPEIERYCEALGQNQMNEQESSRAITELIFSLEISGELIQSLRLWTLEAGAQTVAVRSSVLGEDSRKHSFAGQMESFLFQNGIVQIEKSILKVVASAFSSRSLQYRRLHNLPLSEIKTAVLIQKMIEADFAGVLLTCNPANSSRDEVLISCAPGVGEGVVSGNVDCAEWQLRKSDASIISSTDQINERTLTGLQAQELATLAFTMEKQFGYPLDIEWACKDGIFYFLQARAVTGLSRDFYLGNDLVGDNSNIQESFCGITSPLTFSFASEAYFHVYSQLMREMSFSEADIKEHEDRHRRMLSYVEGRVYYNIRSWYDGLKFLPSFGRNKEDMENMMGVEHPVSFVEDQKLTAAQKFKTLPRLLWIALKLTYKFSRIKDLERRFSTWFEKEYTTFFEQPLGEMNAEELIQLIGKAKTKFLVNWGIPIINDFYVMIYNGKVHRSLESVGLSQLSSQLLFGEELESVEPTKRILQMANLIKNSPSVHEILTNSVTLGDFILQVREFDQELHTEILRYIHDYGDRVAGELKLESLSLRQDATFLLELLRAQTASECMTLEEFRSSEISLRQHAEAKVFEAFRKKGFGAGIIFKRNLNKFRQGIVFRERMRMSRTRVFGLFRMYYQALGERWYSSGLIEQERDIFYLTENEIIELSEGRSAILNIQGQVDLRKADLDSAEGEEPPAHFSTSLPLGKKADFRRPALSIAADLRGLGCFPGAIEGEVQIVRNPSEVHPEEIRGKILVALRTDPGWAPLFMYIKGLIVEKGSSLSHSAIVARELRLPTVVGVSEITQKLKSGDVIRLNGETGQIEIVKKQKLKESNDANRSVTA